MKPSNASISLPRRLPEGIISYEVIHDQNDNRKICRHCEEDRSRESASKADVKVVKTHSRFTSRLVLDRYASIELLLHVCKLTRHWAREKPKPFAPKANLDNPFILFITLLHSTWHPTPIIANSIVSKQLALMIPQTLQNIVEYSNAYYTTNLIMNLWNVFIPNNRVFSLEKLSWNTHTHARAQTAITLTRRYRRTMKQGKRIPRNACTIVIKFWYRFFL